MYSKIGVQIFVPNAPLAYLFGLGVHLLQIYFLSDFTFTTLTGIQYTVSKVIFFIIYLNIKRLNFFCIMHKNSVRTSQDAILYIHKEDQPVNSV
jgi:hypothetical protein